LKAHNPLADPFEQLTVQVPVKGLDLLTQRGLGAKAGLGGPGETAEGLDMAEAYHLRQVHK
jgi:hypothetical protein